MKPQLASLFFGIAALSLVACDSSKAPEVEQVQTAQKKPKVQEQVEQVESLKIKEVTPKFALPFCENKECIDIQIQSIETIDPWVNEWIERKTALVIQDQVGLKQQMKLQQAIDTYVRMSDESDAKTPYTLAVYTRIPYQRHQYVLLQIGVDAEQNTQIIKERYYFFVADRVKQKMLTLLDVIQPDKQIKMNSLIQEAYQKWRQEQSEELQKTTPEKLYWGQADWFFDHDGLGIHYRMNEIAPNSPQFDLYLNLEQTQQVVKPEIYQTMF